MIPLLCVIFALSCVGTSSFGKINSDVLSGASRAKYSLYLIIVGAFACFFFWLFSGLSIKVNLPTLIFAFFFALVAASATVLRMIAFGLASVSGVNIIMSGSNIICSLLIGALLFSEEITFLKIVRALLMIASISFTFLETKKGERTESGVRDGRKRIKLFFVMMFIIVTCCAETVVMKLFTLDRRVSDDNSFFFLTNLLLAIGCAAIVVFDLIRKKESFDNIRDLFKPKRLSCFLGSTFSANLGSIASIGMVALLDVSVYTPMTAALGIISGLVSSIIFKEKLGWASYLAAAIAVVTVII